MNKGLVGLFLSVWLLAFAAPAAHARPGYDPTAGEDPFPLMCVDLSGTWRSDGGDRYQISQRQCSFLKVQMFYGSDSETLTIVPDNRTRPDHGGQVRHRWNSPQNASILESHRTYVESGMRITDVTMLERASDDLLLMTTYRTIECISQPGQPPRHESYQVVFRRVQNEGADQDTEQKTPKKHFRH
jgi:hypothetical protein